MSLLLTLIFVFKLFDKFVFKLFSFKLGKAGAAIFFKARFFYQSQTASSRCLNFGAVPEWSMCELESLGEAALFKAAISNQMKRKKCGTRKKNLKPDGELGKQAWPRPRLGGTGR